MGSWKWLWGALVVPLWEGSLHGVKCSFTSSALLGCSAISSPASSPYAAPPPIRLWRYGVFCAPGHSQLWTGSALMVHEMDVVAFLLLHQDPSAGGADQPVLCRHGRSRDSKWASFQVRMYLFLKVGFYYSKAVISICLVYYTPLLKYLARHSFCLLTGVFTL